MVDGRHGPGLLRPDCRDDPVEDITVTYFAYPELWGWMLAPLVLWGCIVWAARRRAGALRTLGQPPTVLKMLPGGLTPRRRWIAAARVAGLVCFVTDLTRAPISS